MCAEGYLSDHPSLTPHRESDQEEQKTNPSEERSLFHPEQNPRLH